MSLDDPVQKEKAQNDPALFLKTFPPPVLIDEIQYALSLLPYVKMYVDEHPNQKGDFWFTGPQPFHLMKGVSESLAGRVAIVELLGLSRQEALGNGDIVTPFLPTNEKLTERSTWDFSLSVEELYQMIWRGSFPALVLHPKNDFDLFYNTYVQTYLQRDLQDLAHVGDTSSFLRFLRAAAARTGQLLNMVDLARDADIAPNTAKRWLSILAASNIIFLLEPYHTNITKRLVKAPKLYFLDTGLCCWLTGWTSPKTLESGAMAGAILETWMFAEILKSWIHCGKRPRFYYYRDKDQKEIDLLIFQDNTLYPLELKKTASPRANAVGHFHLLEKLNLEIGPGGVVCLVDEMVAVTEKFNAIPVGMLA